MEAAVPAEAMQAALVVAAGRLVAWAVAEVMAEMLVAMVTVMVPHSVSCMNRHTCLSRLRRRPMYNKTDHSPNSTESPRGTCRWVEAAVEGCVVGLWVAVVAMDVVEMVAVPCNLLCKRCCR